MKTNKINVVLSLNKTNNMENWKSEELTINSNNNFRSATPRATKQVHVTYLTNGGLGDPILHYWTTTDYTVAHNMASWL